MSRSTKRRLPAQDRGRIAALVKALSDGLSEDEFQRAAASALLSLDEAGRQRLLFAVGKETAAALGRLEKRFDADVGWFMVDRPPKSPVGQLRARGLVVVGKMAGSGGRMYRTALVPRELRGAVADALASL